MQMHTRGGIPPNSIIYRSIYTSSAFDHPSHTHNGWCVCNIIWFRWLLLLMDSMQSLPSCPPCRGPWSTGGPSDLICDLSLVCLFISQWEGAVLLKKSLISMSGEKIRMPCKIDLKLNYDDPLFSWSPCGCCSGPRGASTSAVCERRTYFCVYRANHDDDQKVELNSGEMNRES